MHQSLFEKIIREPLVHFLVIALLFFVVYDWLNPESNDQSKTIIIGENRVNQLKKGFEKTWTRLPTEIELNKMIQSYALDEIYAREAIALGLGKNDDVVRRRLRQKMEFILQDMSALQQPSDEELAGFYQSNIETYRADNQYSFQQIYIMTNRTQAEIEQLVEQQKQRIKNGQQPVGDNSLLPEKISLSSSHEINRQFGRAFTSALDSVPLNEWFGPINSGLGIHFVLLTKKLAGEAPSLESVKDKVIKDWHYQKNKTFKENYEKELLKQYQVLVGDEVSSENSES